MVVKCTERTTKSSKSLYTNPIRYMKEIDLFIYSTRRKVQLEVYKSSWKPCFQFLAQNHLLSSLCLIVNLS